MVVKYIGDRKEGVYIRVLHQPLWPYYPRGEDGSGGLCRSVGSPDHGEDDGGGTAHHAEERLLGGVVGLAMGAWRSPADFGIRTAYAGLLGREKVSRRQGKYSVYTPVRGEASVGRAESFEAYQRASVYWSILNRLDHQCEFLV